MSTKAFSDRQESMVAMLLDWSVVSGSGAAACYPGDVVSDEWLGECKTHTTRVDQLMFNKKVWDKISQEAMFRRRYPVLFVDNGTQRPDNTWCLVKSISLDLEQCTVLPLCDKVKTNIVLSASDMRIRYAHDCAEHEKIVVYSANWGGENITISPLIQFAEMIGG